MRQASLPCGFAPVCLCANRGQADSRRPVVGGRWSVVSGRLKGETVSGTSDRAVWVVNLGTEPYGPVHELQRRLVAAKQAGWPQDVLLLLEHEPVYTLGRQSQAEDILVPAEFLAEQGIPLVPVERGGKVTYHGPGQIVGYPILDLRGYRTEVKWFYRQLADVIIRTLADFDVVGTYDDSFPGVWVGGKKICAFGTAISRWITYHGWALNIEPDMAHWGWIVPCGLRDKEVTSLRAELGIAPPGDDIRAGLTQHFGAVFGRRMVEREIGDVEREA